MEHGSFYTRGHQICLRCVRGLAGRTDSLSPSFRIRAATHARRPETIWDDKQATLPWRGDVPRLPPPCCPAPHTGRGGGCCGVGGRGAHQDPTQAPKPSLCSISQGTARTRGWEGLCVSIVIRRVKIILLPVIACCKHSVPTC